MLQNKNNIKVLVICFILTSTYLGGQSFKIISQKPNTATSIVSHAPHSDIFYSIPTKKAIKLSNKDILQFKITNEQFYRPGFLGFFDDKYKKYKDRDVDELLFIGADSDNIEFFFDFFEGGIFEFTYERFNGGSKFYEVLFNLDESHPELDVYPTGRLLVLNKNTHLNRNKYNRVAKGKLTKVQGSIWIDENGCEWEIMPQSLNKYHNPERTVKLLHKLYSYEDKKLVPAGEFETIRKILIEKGEGYIDSDGTVAVSAETLEGPNIIKSELNGASYNFGHSLGFSTNSEAHLRLDIIPHDDSGGIMDGWGNSYVNPTIELYMQGCKTQSSALPTLFLFDRSGSMADAGASGASKIAEAKSAAKSTLQSMQSAVSQGASQEVGMLTFNGGCSTDPTSPAGKVSFTSDIGAAIQNVDHIGSPGGGTPLAEAIRASKQKLEARLQETGAKSGKLIILSDGEATCGKIRPEDVYAFGQSGQVTRLVNSAQQAGLVSSGVKYYTVGFNIPPGSPAERDLQFLAQISGGKYLNAQNQVQLARAFKKFNRIYIPKPAPALANTSSEATRLFEDGLMDIRAEDYEAAMEQYKQYIQQQSRDCHGAYNLALMLEANDYYKSAIEAYEQYLSLCPSPSDEAFVQERIGELSAAYREYLDFNRRVVESDMQYLDLHFKKIQNGHSVALAKEFIGFLKEKWAYYENLPGLLEIDSRIFEVNAKAVFRGLKSCAETIKRNPKNWDRDATPALSRTYLNMERLLKTF